MLDTLVGFVGLSGVDQRERQADQNARVQANVRRGLAQSALEQFCGLEKAVVIEANQGELVQGDLFVRGGIVADYVFSKDRLFASLTLSNDELGLYERIYQMLRPRVATPGLVVGSPATAGPGGGSTAYTIPPPQ